MKKFLDNVKVINAFLVVSVLPVLLSVGLASWVIVGNAASVREMVHEQQKERGMTAVFMVKNSEKLQGERAIQGRETDLKISKATEFLATEDVARIDAELATMMGAIHGTVEFGW